MKKQSKPQTESDKFSQTISEIRDEIKALKNDDIFVCLQDCLKKIKNIKKDHGN
jgi:hypothetical protein